MDTQTNTCPRLTEECLDTLVAQLTRFRKEVLVVLEESVAAIETGDGGVVLVLSRTQFVSVTVAVGFEYVVALDGQFQRLSGEYVLHQSVLDVRAAIAHGRSLMALPARLAGGYDWIGMSSAVGGASGGAVRTTRRSQGLVRPAGAPAKVRKPRSTGESPLQQPYRPPPSQQQYPTPAPYIIQEEYPPAESSRTAQARQQPATSPRTVRSSARTSATSPPTAPRGPSVPSRALSSTLSTARSTATTARRTTSSALTSTRSAASALGSAASRAGRGTSAALRRLGRIRIPLRIPRRPRRVPPPNPFCPFAQRLQANPALHATGHWHWRDSAPQTRLLYSPGTLPRVCPDCEAELYDEVLRHSDYHVTHQKRKRERMDLTPRWRAKYHVPGGGVRCKWCVRKGKGQEMREVRDLWRHLGKCRERGWRGKEGGGDVWECPVERRKLASEVDVDYVPYRFVPYSLARRAMI